MPPVNCTLTGCENRLPYDFFATVDFEDRTRVLSADCSRNFVYFTDDPGVVSVSENDTTAYLNNTDNGTKQNVFSLADVKEHWQECSRTYQELSWFFNISAGRGRRGNSIVVAYRDPAESWEDAYIRLTKCFCCFRWVSHVSASADGLSLYSDQPQQISFATLLRSERRIPMFPTADYTNLTGSYTEIVSIPGQAGSSDVGAAWFLMNQNDGCTYDCKDGAGADQNLLWYQPDHIMAAAIASSYGFTDTTYNWTLFMKPPNGWPGARSTDLTQNEVINVTGINPQTGLSIDAARSVNLYVASKARTRGFIEGLTDNGYFIDDIAKRYAIEEDMLKTILEYTHNVEDAILTSEEDIRVLDNLMIQKARTYINKKITFDRLPDGIADNLDEYPDYKWSNTFEDIIDGGDGYGWVLARKPLDEFSEAELSQRFGVVYFYCYISNRPLHRARINICSTLKPLQIA